MKQPEIHVGIVSADEIRVKNNPENASFTLCDVPIGIDFHWERKEDQEFKGELKIIRENGKLTAINVISLEDYLESVISSEMAATSSLELLKAHAVISRSWLMAQIEKAKDTDRKKFPAIVETEDEYIRWYDREDHENFNALCAGSYPSDFWGISCV
jgi:hypothetical protein